MDFSVCWVVLKVWDGDVCVYVNILVFGVYDVSVVGVGVLFGISGCEVNVAG